MESIISSLIMSGLTLIGVIITNMASNRRVEQQLITAQAVTDTKLDNLTAEVRQHNEFAKRIPILENDISRLKEDIKVLEKEVHRNE